MVNISCAVSQKFCNCRGQAFSISAKCCIILESVYYRSALYRGYTSRLSHKGELHLEKYVIRGGKPLVGDVNIGGAKNAAVAILPATILAGGKCLIENLPCISDVMASLQILSELGASIRMVSRSTYEIDTSHLDSTEVSNELSRQILLSRRIAGPLWFRSSRHAGRLQSGPAPD